MKTWRVIVANGESVETKTSERQMEKSTLIKVLEQSGKVRSARREKDKSIRTKYDY